MMVNKFIYTSMIIVALLTSLVYFLQKAYRAEKQLSIYKIINKEMEDKLEKQKQLNIKANEYIKSIEKQNNTSPLADIIIDDKTLKQKQLIFENLFNK